MNILVKLNTASSDTGPFLVYTNLSNYAAPAYGPYTKAELTAGVVINVPNATTSIKVRSNGKCTNDIILNLPVTTSTTSTTSTTTSSTTTTTCSPQEFFMEFANITSITNMQITATEPFAIFWDASDPSSRVNYAAGTYTNISKTYSPAFTGFVKIQSCDLGTITKLVIPDNVVPNTSNTIVIEQSELVKLTGLVEFRTPTSTFVSGITTSNLNRSLRTIVIRASDISGNIEDLPAPLSEFDVRTSTAAAPGLTGSITTLYATRPALNVLHIAVANIITGDISSIPSTAIRFFLTGSNTVGGNFSSLSDNTAMVTFTCNGANTIAGSINSVVWTNITSFEVGGSGIKTGNIDAISFNSNIFQLSFPSSDTNNASGITGNLSSLPNSIQFLNLSDCSTLGAAADIPTSCTTLVLGANNALSGTVTGLPTGLQQIVLSGDLHTITGLISSLPANLRFVRIQGSGHNVSGYTGTREWGTLNFAISGQRTMCKLAISGAAMTSLSSSEADSLIIDLEATSDWRDSSSFLSDPKLVEYKGAAVSSPAGIAAKDALALPPRSVSVINI